jgi:hypothetical protein
MTEWRKATNVYLEDLVEGCILLLSVQCLADLRVDQGALRRSTLRANSISLRAQHCWHLVVI